MLKIFTYLLLLYFIFLSPGDVRVFGEELLVQTSENDAGSSATDTQSGIRMEFGVYTDYLPDLHVKPQEPYTHVTDELLADDDADDGNNDDLVPPTPTHGIHVSGSKGHTTPVDTENMGSKDSTSQEVDYTLDSSFSDKLTKTLIQSDDGAAVREEVQTLPESSSQEVKKEEAGASTEPERIPKPFSKAKEDELPQDAQLQAATQVFDEILQTQTTDINKMSVQLPSSERGPYPYDLPVATEALKSVTPGSWDGVSDLPVGVGGMAVDPQVMQDAMMPTHFSGFEDIDESKKKPGEEEFPTFDKWSMQYLAEQEKQKIVKEQEQVVSPSTLLIQKKLRQNFAASSCGAKVVASNAEAENINYLLNGNPDEYLLSPCKAKKWFVVELCEPLQIHRVEMGSLEMFASLPKSFRLSASQRYPTKDWMPIGKFDMTPDRVIQSFNIQASEEFVKFVRVEVQEHHGDEHYCPITTFRVLGVDMASDDDDVNDNETVESDDEKTIGDIEDDEVEESVNLFTSAKETVVKLVKKVLYKGDQESDGKDGSSDNTTAKAEDKKGDGVACPEKKDPTDAPTASIPDLGVVSPPPAVKEPEDIPIVTKLADTEQLPMVVVEAPVIIKLEKGSEVGDDRRSKHGLLDLPSRSWWNLYLRMMARARLRSSTCPARPKPSAKLQEKPSPVSDIQETSIPTVTVTSDRPADYGKVEIHPEQGAQETLMPSDAQVKGSAPLDHKSISQSEKDTSASVQRQQTVGGGETVLSTSDHQQHQQADELSSTSQAKSFTSSGVSATRSEALEPSSLCSQADTDVVVDSLQTPGLNVQQSRVVEQGTASLVETMFLKVSPSPTMSSEDSVAVDEDTQQEGPTASEQQADLNRSDDGLIPDSDQGPGQEGQFDVLGSQGQFTDQAKTQTSGSNVTGSSSKTTKPIDLVKVGVPSSLAKRDTSIMKLSNRIMALEQNVSMTKKYLEELSRAFKQQNEDMMKLLNKTEKKLSNFITQSEEKESRQQLMVDVLELRVANLTQVVDTMQQQMNSMGKELRDAQFLLAFFQVIMFVWLMITSYRGRGKSPLVYTDHQFLLDTMPKKPMFERKEGEGRQRRNSDCGIQSGAESPGPALKRQISEANLAPAAGAKQAGNVIAGSVFLQETAQVSKKRKKKKLKQQQLSVDSASSVLSSSSSPPSRSTPTQTSSFSSYAGVLFGTEGSSRSKENIQPEDSVSPAFAKTNEIQDIRKDMGISWKHQNFAGPGCSQFDAISLTSNLKLGSRHESNKEIYNSTVVRESGYKDKAPSPLAVINSFEDRIPSFHYNGHEREAVDTALPESQLNNRQVTVTSPEFKLPLYHRNKIRKVVDSNSDDQPGGGGHKVARLGVSSIEECKRRRSVGFINPKGGEELFLAENYLSENRFKFPLSPASSATMESGISSGRSTDLFTFGSGVPVNGSPIDEKHPTPSSSSSHPAKKHFQSHPPALTKGSTHHKSMSSLSNSSLSSLASSSKSLPHTPTFVHFDHDTAPASFNQDFHIPQSLSQLSSKSLPRGPHQMQKGRHPQMNTGPPVIHSHRQRSDRKASFHLVDNTDEDTTLPDATTSHHHHPRNKINHGKPHNDLQTHCPQHSSPPPAQLKASRSLEKDSLPNKQGSAEGIKQSGRPSTSGNVPGTSKIRKSSSLSSFSKKKLPKQGFL